MSSSFAQLRCSPVGASPPTPPYRTSLRSSLWGLAPTPPARSRVRVWSLLALLLPVLWLGSVVVAVRSSREASLGPSALVSGAGVVGLLLSLGLYYMQYSGGMSEVLWRMPQPEERPQADLGDGLTVADVAEALEQPAALQFQQRGDLQRAYIAPAADGRLVSILLFRNDDSFVWRVRAARLAGPAETEIWSRRGD